MDSHVRSNPWLGKHVGIGKKRPRNIGIGVLQMCCLTHKAIEFSTEGVWKRSPLQHRGDHERSSA